MGNRIKITEAISLCNASTSIDKKYIEQSIRDRIWPDNSDVNTKQNLRKLKKNKEIFRLVHIICQETGVDANFLFEIN